MQRSPKSERTPSDGVTAQHHNSRNTLRAHRSPGREPPIGGNVTPAELCRLAALVAVGDRRAGGLRFTEGQEERYLPPGSAGPCGEVSLYAHVMSRTYCWSCDEHRQDGDRVTRRCRLVRLNGRWMRCSCRWCVAKRGAHTYHGDERVIQRNTFAPKRSRRPCRRRSLASTSNHGMLCRPQLWVHSWRHMSWHYRAPPPSRSHK